MKAKYLGTAVLAAALALAGCGGKTEFTINGTFYNSGGYVTGVPNSGMELTNGNDTISIPVGATTFSFPTAIEYGDTFNVIITKQPLHMTCTPPNTSGTAGRTESVTIPITCAQNTYSVLVTISGLTGEGLQLSNGSVIAAPAAAATSAEFAGIPVGSAYGIAIFSQPAGQTCDITNGSGVMGDANRADVTVTCKATGT
jgi:hypothetical protein